MSKLTIDDLVQAQLNNELQLKRIAALLRDDAPKPMSKVSHWVIILTYACLFTYGICATITFCTRLPTVQSAAQESSLAAVFAAETVVCYVIARSVELAMRARDRI